MSLKPLKTAKGYYDRAWKVVIKTQRPHWKGGKFAQCNPAADMQLTDIVATITKNLAWLWASRTQAEEDECNRLVAAQSTALPTIDQSILPARSIPRADDPPHPRAAGRGHGGRPAPTAPGPSAPGPSVAVPPAVRPSNVPAAARSDSDINTTRFSFWPESIDRVRLPPGGRRGDERWRLGGLLLRSEQQYEKNWEGVQLLGEGSGGRATAWVKVDENETIIDVCILHLPAASIELITSL
jgi:hypothetical protein